MQTSPPQGFTLLSLWVIGGVGSGGGGLGTCLFDLVLLILFGFSDNWP